MAGLFSGLTFDELLPRLRDEGLEAVELAGGGWPGTPHVDPVRAARDQAYAKGVRDALDALELSALAVHGNPLHPREGAADDDAGLRAAIRGARALGTRDHHLLLGLPGHARGRRRSELGDLPLAT